MPLLDPRLLPNLAELVAQCGHVDIAEALMAICDSPDWQALVPDDLQGGFTLACRAAWEAIDVHAP
jgi:hypothetical protein